MTGENWLAVTNEQALRFFFERLKDVTGDVEAPSRELLYNASVLAHFATTSTASATFPATPANLSAVFDLFVLDRSLHVDPDVAEVAAAQCLLLTGFFQDQLRHRHNLEWYASLGAGFFDAAAQCGDRNRASIMHLMSVNFALWRERQRRLAAELRDEPRLLHVPPPPPPSWIM